MIFEMEKNSYQFRKALLSDLQGIWGIILFAKEMRKQEGSQQWQDGYPNEKTIRSDIEKGYGNVIESEGEIVAYFALIFDKEPAYEVIEGKWKTQGDYAVVHRMAVAKSFKGKGIGKEILKKVEKVSIQNNVFSVRIDTNFDNIPMLRILEKLGYVYCGEVYFRGSARKAFEKVLVISGNL
ncbi:GNAT family N-acetyltransferase [Capnocytophaga felis]|uniref:N-acetyltransferase n=1 Tax=Capnocytophaga felis TaxID=2267611 RepID=A0A5M4BB65_9FLAO|nr:GNAT family N-acetyltransferase [Capnocytophaga felis]GET46346.1 N-acetyltransferase [Capnocytophaga felis]GET48176.1 N-acetyltransferase [Capnocytophaga felis]